MSIRSTLNRLEKFMRTYKLIYREVHHATYICIHITNTVVTSLKVCILQDFTKKMTTCSTNDDKKEEKNKMIIK